MPHPRHVLLDSYYDGNSLNDITRDVEESLDSDMSLLMAKIPQDEYGFMKGTLRVTIEWKDE